MLGFRSRETNVSMPRAVTEKVAAHFPVPFVRGPREKARTDRMWRKRERALLSPPSTPQGVNARESFPLPFTVVALGRSVADQIIRRHLRSFWLRTRYKSSREFPGSRHIYTICRDRNEPAADYFAPGPRPEGPVVRFLECTSYFVVACRGVVSEYVGLGLIRIWCVYIRINR